MVGRVIHSDACLAEGMAWLAAQEPRLGEAYRATGPLPLRRRAGGYPALLDAICAQQLSVAAADSVWAKLEAAGATTPEGLLRHDDASLRACGLSRPKIRYARALAEAGIDYEGLAGLPDAEVIETLTKVKGIGVWTAEIYALSALGRADVIAAGDLALQEAARVLFDLAARPKEGELRALAEPWSPWRAVAARLLWSYYRVVKGRAGLKES